MQIHKEPEKVLGKRAHKQAFDEPADDQSKGKKKKKPIK